MKRTTCIWRKILFLVTLSIFPILFCACWDYHSLDSLTITAGIAVDRDPNNPNGYLLSFEIVNSSITSSESGMETIVLQSTGNTIQEAIHRAEEKLHGNVYFGNTELLIISQDLLEDGLSRVINDFLRDHGTRDTLTVLVSREEFAHEIFPSKENQSSTVLSYTITKFLSENRHSLNGTHFAPLHQIYDDSKTPSSSVILPAMRIDREEQQHIAVLDGAAVFHGDSFKGFLEQTQLPSLLFISERLEAGAFSVFNHDPQQRMPLMTLNVMTCNPSIAVKENDQGRICISVSLDMMARIVDLSQEFDTLDSQVAESIGNHAEIYLEQYLRDEIVKTQSSPLGDCFSFSDWLYRHNLPLWDKVKDNWQALYRTADISVSADILINDSGLILAY